MSNYNFNYAFNISGNCNAVVAEISGGVENLQRNLRATTSLWDTFEGKILAFNQVTQYVQNLSDALSNTLVPGAALESLKEITAFIDLLGAVTKDADERWMQIEKNCDFIALSVKNEFYQGLREEKLISNEQSLVVCSARRNNVNSFSRHGGESASLEGNNREIITSNPHFLSKIVSQSVINQINQSIGLLAKIETNEQYICSNKKEKEIREQCFYQEIQGVKLLGQSIYLANAPAERSVAGICDAQSIIFNNLAIRKLQESIIGAASLNSLKQRINEDKEKTENSNKRCLCISTGWEIRDNKSSEQSAIGKSLSSVCEGRSGIEYSYDKRYVITEEGVYSRQPIVIEKMIDHIIVNHNGNDELDFKSKLQECLVDVLFDIQRRVRI